MLCRHSHSKCVVITSPVNARTTSSNRQTTAVCLLPIRRTTHSSNAATHSVPPPPRTLTQTQTHSAHTHLSSSLPLPPSSPLLPSPLRPSMRRLSCWPSSSCAAMASLVPGSIADWPRFRARRAHLLLLRCFRVRRSYKCDVTSCAVQPRGVGGEQAEGCVSVRQRCLGGAEGSTGQRSLYPAAALHWPKRVWAQGVAIATACSCSTQMDAAQLAYAAFAAQRCASTALF